MSKAFNPRESADSGVERRAERRLLCSTLVQASWCDANGAHHAEFGVLEDLTSGGFGLSMQFDTPPDRGAALSILADRLSFTGRVVECTSRGEDGYLLGLELDEPCERVDDLEQVLDLTLLDLG